MYLKSIEIQGFKSFANKILFEFHNGITGIVGPNGSGKSNVADAVRWVLGEQRSRQLRGGTMQDVIFAGTELRKPQGFAYVAITLDNADHKLQIEYDEVTVSRRLYRSGESEYKINGTSCRLKDINELFYDTGIGKEGYSIIGQGQIDQILSGRPEECSSPCSTGWSTACRPGCAAGLASPFWCCWLWTAPCCCSGDAACRINQKRTDLVSPLSVLPSSFPDTAGCSGTSPR